MIRTSFVLALALSSMNLNSIARADDPPVILSMRERAALMDRWLEKRFETVVPDLMRREGVDMWILIAREYNEDPVLKTMLPAEWLSARRRTMLVFADPGEGKDIERLAVARYDVGTLFKSAWDKEKQPDQWARLVEIVVERDPETIAVNTSSDFGHADGMAHTDMLGLLEALPSTYRDRIVSAEALAVGWLETRTAEEMTVYPMVCRIAHEIIADALSDRVVQPGVTTTEDVTWWCRERIRELKLRAWFHPTVSIQRAESEQGFVELFSGGSEVILPGDLLHIDLGITYLGLNTDTQRMCYVLKPGETEAPRGVREAFAKGNRMQDILTGEFRAGRSGNDVLASALAQAKSEGLQAMVYTHPLGYHGHGAGATIGMWDAQGGVPGSGDYPLRADTAWSIELNVEVAIPEWNGKIVRIMREEDALFTDAAVRYIDGRQRELMLIRGAR